ncbi:MAG: hypothetical protein KatS3mg055_2548 [Chloroflexus sp.]|nr:MAG: hypothetical protein KatS3mg055_2548 [Chloroflexus sp.]
MPCPYGGYVVAGWGNGMAGGRHGGTACRGDPAGRPDAMGDARMGDAPRRPYVNRRGMWGHGTACM